MTMKRIIIFIVLMILTHRLLGAFEFAACDLSDSSPNTSPNTTNMRFNSGQSGFVNNVDGAGNNAWVASNWNNFLFNFTNTFVNAVTNNTNYFVVFFEYFDKGSGQFELWYDYRKNLTVSTNNYKDIILPNFGNTLMWKTNYVIIGKEPGSKYEKAKNLRIKTISEKEFLNLLK